MASDNNMIKLTSEKAIECLKEILERVRNNGTSNESLQFGSIESAREAAGNDMVSLMSRVYPIIACLTAQSIASLGYSPDDSGVLQFERAVQALLPQDPELARLHSELRSYYLPAVVFPDQFTENNT